MKTKIEKSEKRKDERFTCFVPVESKKGATFDKTQTVDISKNGIGFISPKPISLDEKIAIEIVLTPESDPVLVQGKVQWVRQLSGSENYRVGLSFADSSTGFRSRLGKYFSSYSL